MRRGMIQPISLQLMKSREREQYPEPSGPGSICTMDPMDSAPKLRLTGRGGVTGHSSNLRQPTLPGDRGGGAQRQLSCHMIKIVFRAN